MAQGIPARLRSYLYREPDGWWEGPLLLIAGAAMLYARSAMAGAPGSLRAFLLAVATAFLLRGLGEVIYPRHRTAAAALRSAAFAGVGIALERFSQRLHG